MDGQELYAIIEQFQIPRAELVEFGATVKLTGDPKFLELRGECYERRS